MIKMDLKKFNRILKKIIGYITNIMPNISWYKSILYIINYIFK